MYLKKEMQGSNKKGDNIKDILSLLYPHFTN